MYISRNMNAPSLDLCTIYATLGIKGTQHLIAG